MMRKPTCLSLASVEKPFREAAVTSEAGDS